MQTYGSRGSWVSLCTRLTRDGCPVYSSLSWCICGTAVRVAILASTATLSILCPRIYSQLLAAAVVLWGSACFCGHRGRCSNLKEGCSCLRLSCCWL